MYILSMLNKVKAMFDTSHVPLYYEYSANVAKKGSGGRCHLL